VTHPYIPLYVDDYEAATAHLTPEEDGIYSRLLRLCWRTPGCSLPNDPVWIARKIRITADDFDRIARPVIDDFFKVVRGRLVQKRLKAEYENISRKKSARVKAGKAGGDAKARKTHDNDPSNASVLLAHTRAFPEPDPEPDTQIEDKLLSVTRTSRFDFEAWFRRYPEAVAKPKARQAYAAARAKIGGDDPDAVLWDGLTRSLASSRWKDPTHTKPNPARWLEEERWNDAGPEVTAAVQVALRQMSPELIAARRALLEQTPEQPNA
jgi:uncharacterized protein YdaU (DUF1376 family)